MSEQWKLVGSGIVYDQLIELFFTSDDAFMFPAD